MKGPVSYDQRTTTLKGVEKVNDMIDEGQEAISSKTNLSAMKDRRRSLRKRTSQRLVKRVLIPKLKNVKKCQNQIIRIDLF